MPTTSAYVSFLGASQPPGVVLVVARKTWISHGIRRAKNVEEAGGGSIPIRDIATGGKIR